MYSRVATNFQEQLYFEISFLGYALKCYDCNEFDSCYATNGFGESQTCPPNHKCIKLQFSAPEVSGIVRDCLNTTNLEYKNGCTARNNICIVDEVCYDYCFCVCDTDHCNNDNEFCGK